MNSRALFSSSSLGVGWGAVLESVLGPGERGVEKAGMHKEFVYIWGR